MVENPSQKKTFQIWAIYSDCNEKQVLMSIIDIIGLFPVTFIDAKDAGFPDNLKNSCACLLTANPALIENIPELESGCADISKIHGFHDFVRCLEGLISHDSSVFEASGNDFLDRVENSIAIILHNKNMPYLKKCFWPHNKNFCAIFSHDIDALEYIPKFSSSPVKRIYYHICSLLNKPLKTHNIDNITSIMKKHEIPSTFFFLPKYADDKTPLFKEIVETLVKDGFEIALHGVPGTHNSRDELSYDRKKLQSLVEDTICGIRMHTLAFRPPFSWKAMADAGFSYDATFAFNDYFGFRAGIVHPYRPIYLNVNNDDCCSDNNIKSENKNNNIIIEIPTSFMDFTAIKNGLTGEEVGAVIEKIVNEVETRQGVFLSIFHNKYIDDDRFLFGEVMVYAIALLKKRGAWITTAKECANWWHKRNITEISIEFINETGFEIKASEDCFVKIFYPPKKTDNSLEENLKNTNYLKALKTETVSLEQKRQSRLEIEVPGK